MRAYDWVVVGCAGLYFLGMGVIALWLRRQRSCTHPDHLDAKYTATACPGCECPHTEWGWQYDAAAQEAVYACLRCGAS